LISPDTIALVRDRTDLAAVVTESVPSLKRRGRSWVGLCPFHKEKTPSFHVNPDRGFFHCFGCKEAGSAIDFVMKVDGLTFPEAVRSLAERAGVAIEEERGERTEVDRQKKQREDLYAVNHLAATFFEQQLRAHPQRQFALQELARRALVPTWGRAEATPPDASGVAPAGAHDGPVADLGAERIDDTLQAFRIGYAPPGWDGLANFLKAQGVSPVAAEAVGLLVPRASSGVGSGAPTWRHYDRFRHRLMFAVIDPQGRVVAFSGRALKDLPDTPKPEQPPPKYINSPESPIYTKGNMLFGLYQARHTIRQQEAAVVVEGNFDVVSLHAHGVANVVAPLGTAFTADQSKLLRRYAPNVVLLFDGDAAGRAAVQKSREPCMAAGLGTKVASLAGGVDPDEFVRSQGAARLGEVLARAQGMLEYLIEMELDATFGSADAHERAERVARVNKVLSDEKDPIVRSMAKAYADQVAGRLDLVRAGADAFRALERSVQHALAEESARPRGPTPSQARIKAKVAGAAERAEIVGAVIEYPALLDDPEVSEQLGLLEGPSARTVAAVSESVRIRLVGTPPTPQKTLDTSNFLAQIPSAIQAFASRRLAAPEHLSLEEARGHLLENAQKLRRVMLERETNDIARETYKAAGDWERETELARDATERARQKHGL
jgi:DNA primase